MKKLKLFPKIFIYTLALLLLITMLASGTIYLLAPMMGENSVLSEGTYVDGISSAIKTAAIPRNTEIAHTILRSLPYTVAICIVVSLLCAYFFSKAITNPIKGILDATNHMAVLDRKAACKTATNDEIGILANQINQLYQNLLSTIEHLQEEKDKVSEAEKQKIDFLRSASHELKTPLTILKGHLLGMLNKIKGYENHEEYMERSLAVVDKMETLVRELLYVSKVDGNQKSEYKLIDFAELVRVQIAEAADLLSQKEQHLEADIPDKLLCELEPAQIERAIQNILVNAIRYSPNGERIRISLTKENDTVYCEIENTGIHIPEDTISHLFQAFYRGDISRNRNTGGTGLGLFIVRKIMELHQAKYGIKNSSSGVLFWFVMSAKRSSDNSI